MAGADSFHDWQLDALLKAAAQRSRREAAWLTLLLHTGFRPREILNCRIGDIASGTQVRQILHLRRSRLKGGRGRRRRIVSSRAIPLSSAAVAAVGAYLDECQAQGGLHPSQPLFRSRQGGPLSIWRANAILQELIETAGFAGTGRFSLHSGRKTFATRLYQTSRCLLTTRDGLGHARAETTERYLGSFHRQAMELAASLWEQDAPTDPAVDPNSMQNRSTQATGSNPTRPW
jgi:integrase